MAREYTNLARRQLSQAIVVMGRSDLQGGGAERAIVATSFGGDQGVLDIVKRGTVAVATTVGTTAFNETRAADLVNLLGPGSASAKIFAAALGVSFDGAAGIFVPTVTASATGVQFVKQGDPIRVEQFSFSGPTLTPMKCAMIAGFTREIIEASNADILVKALLAENLGIGLDTLLLDASAATADRPAGLRNGVGATGATSGGGITAMSTDLANLAAAVAPIANGGQIVFCASPKQAAKIALLRTSPLAFPVFSTAGLADGIVLALAANALAVAGGNDPPKISVSKEAVLHFEDTTPLPIEAGSTTASPVRSLFQTDAIAVKIVADITWALRATGAVSWVQSVTW